MNRTLVIVLSLSVLSLVVYYFVIKSIVEKRNTGRSYIEIPLGGIPTIETNIGLDPVDIKDVPNISSV